MSYRVELPCDGCGMCLRACPRGAIRPLPLGDPPVEVASLDCNDCGKCAIVCPEDALTPDEAWAVCWGRGCPLTANRFEGWACAEGLLRCSHCGNALWKSPDARRWACIRCDAGRRMLCPKVRKATALEQATATAAPTP